MANRQLLCGIMLLHTLIGGVACAFFVKANTVEYDFDNGWKHRRLVMDIPVGFVEETHDRDAKGYQVRTFRYLDGAEVFLACRDLGNNPVTSLDLSAETLASFPKIWGEPGSGTNKNGTKWCRHLREGFMVGYDFVDPNRTELFDQSLHSLHIVH
jgi:hypothetical protein